MSKPLQTNTYKRRYKKWTINEHLALEREYELLNMSVPQIAKKHKRTISAILYQLHNEGLIDNQHMYYDECT